MIGADVRGRSDRDLEALAAEARLGKVFNSTVTEICRHVRSGYQSLRAGSPPETGMLRLFLDAIFLPTGPTRAK